MTKARVCKGAGQEGSPGVTFHTPGNVGECEGMNPTLPSVLPLWELEFWWTLESSESNWRGQNPLDWKFCYIIGKFLEHRCLKWARMTHLDTSNTSYGQKKGWESNWQFDSRPLKVENSPDFLLCKCNSTYHWKALDKGYNFALDLISIEGLHTKSWESQLWEFRDSNLGVSRQNDIWVLVPWPDIEYTIRGKVVASPKSELWCVLCTKVLQLHTNQLVVWFCVGPCE
jgi:hypothetical protein